MVDNGRTQVRCNLPAAGVSHLVAWQLWSLFSDGDGWGRCSLRRHLVSLLFLHVLWVVLQTLYELCHRVALIADLIDCTEQWEPGGRGKRRSKRKGSEQEEYAAWFMGFSSQCEWRKRRSVLRYSLVDEVFVLQDEMHLGSCGRSLQLLTVQHLSLQLLDRLRDGSSVT